MEETEQSGQCGFDLRYSLPVKQGLYDPSLERDSCGVGCIANLNGEPSHSIVESSIDVLCRLLHRGAKGGDENTGDGAGILTQIPDEFFRSIYSDLPQKGEYAVGVFFLPKIEQERQRSVELIESTAADSGFVVLHWRAVPVFSEKLGEKARAEEPVIMQAFFVQKGNRNISEHFEVKLFILRKKIENSILKLCPRIDGIFYIPSLSSQTIVYKGLMMATQLKQYYPDLNNPLFKTALAIIHQRYSTNTFPTWQLAQPFRMLAHNGEINTLRGNIGQMRARERRMSLEKLAKDISAEDIIPIIQEGGSDSAALDNALELLVMAGRDLPHAMMMLIPEAWGQKYPIGPDLKGFFEFHSGLMEPWDGPAAVVFSNGTQIGALLDRNGLRPARYTLTNDGLFIMASEAGVIDIEPANIAEKGALRPGQIIIADLAKKRLLKNNEVKALYSRRQPYRRWVEENRISLHGFFDAVSPVTPDESTLFKRAKLFGYTREDLRTILEPMAVKGNEPVGSMGADTPLAVFSEKPQLLYNYFRQLFAQVTNPPIDPIREELVMSLMTFMGNSPDILLEYPQQAHLIKLRHPVLSNDDLSILRNMQKKGFGQATIDILFSAEGGANTLEEALENICEKAEAAIQEGAKLIILSDKQADENNVPIPALLAVSALNQYLIRKGLRTSAAIIAETGEAREVMHLALLLGYGATTVNPYLAFEIVAHMALNGDLSSNINVTTAIDNYIHALCKGLLKIMSKMGISTLRSYRGAQVFEAIGLSHELVDKYFTGTSSRIGGIGLNEIALEVLNRCKELKNSSLLSFGGKYQYRRDGERHLWSPEAIAKLQQAVRTNSNKLYCEYAELINNQTEKLSTIRGAFSFKKTNAIPIEEVESAESIIKRFVTGAMSFGSLSPEAHYTIAEAMNRLGAKSNSGEGGEDASRYKPTPDGKNFCSAVKQVASGRFGVTAEYLVNAKELQIKIAQGAKPGEGGQLPGHKVNATIAKVRHSIPGVTLISPPPHHDIYSIEDLSQLIYDLKCVNPDAQVSVKLVSELGVGTIAAGVAKGGADIILISGADGGTGASPLSSIHYAGMPWELGLAETHQTLLINGLRDKVRLQTDGQLKTGRDVLIAAMLGADEFGFATTALVSLGCVMMRKCHQNTCPVGVATQDPELRKRFAGKPEHLINFFKFIAEEVRQLLATLGLRSLDEAIGRVDLLEQNKDITFWKAQNIDLSPLFYKPPVSFPTAQNRTIPKIRGTAFDLEIMPMAEKAISSQEKVIIERSINNTMRTIGATIAGKIAKIYGSKGLKEDSIILKLKGAAGQSFGAFATKGMSIILEGEANDYVGKALSGGKIIIYPYRGIKKHLSQNVIAGNTVLYGATDGELYIAGSAGERFAVRNSGATAVVEGVGDHGCEYMTGGVVVILGETGVNFAAGMSGGIAYVLDEHRKLDQRSNLEMVDLENISEAEDIDLLYSLIAKHFNYTQSPRAKEILENWNAFLPLFVKVFPMEYRKALGKMIKEDEKVQREEPTHA